MKRKQVWGFFFCCCLFLLWWGVACQPLPQSEGSVQDGGERAAESISSPEKDASSEAVVSEPSPEQGPEGPTDQPKGDISLLDHTKWLPTPPEQDPFRQKWPTLGAERCQGDFAWHLDKDALELDTEICNFITLEQPMLASIKKGDSLKLGLWHVQLYSDKDVEAVVMIQAGDAELWTKTIPIPSKANYYEPRFEAPADVPKGAKLSFHIHNHGLNSWYLLYLVVSK